MRLFSIPQKEVPCAAPNGLSSLSRRSGVPLRPTLPLYWYVMLPINANPVPSTDEIVEGIHQLFREGVMVPQPQSIQDNIALDFYNAITDSDLHPYFILLFPSLDGAQAYMRGVMARDYTIYKVDPDDRAFNFARSLNNLVSAISNPASQRTQIMRFLMDAPRNIGNDVLVGGMPLPSDVEPIDHILRSVHIRRAFVYFDNTLARRVERGEEDGAFVAPVATQVTQGYEFRASPVDFPVEGRRVLVFPGTYNLTSFATCDPTTRLNRNMTLKK